jgi:hypothetical protein
MSAVVLIVLFLSVMGAVLAAIVFVKVRDAAKERRARLGDPELRDACAKLEALRMAEDEWAAVSPDARRFALLATRPPERRP